MNQATKTILVIDDDHDFQFMVGLSLENSGFSVEHLEEGPVETAMEYARNCDMILLDIQLPDIDGVDLAKKLKASPGTEKIPIILVTGHSDPERMLFESNANALFRKPFSLAALLDKISELLNPRNNHLSQPKFT